MEPFLCRKCIIGVARVLLGNKTCSPIRRYSKARYTTASYTPEDDDQRLARMRNLQAWREVRVVESGPRLTDESFLESNQEKIKLLAKKIEEIEKENMENFQQRSEERIALIKRIQDQVCTPNSKVVPIGSSITGLAFDMWSSDIDLCFVSKDPAFIDDFYQDPDFRRIFMAKVAELVEDVGNDDPTLKFTRPASLLPDAYSPLVEISFKNGWSLDIAFPKNDYHALRNTNLIKLYVTADPRFSQLYLWLRTLLYSLGVKESKAGLLSSYHIQMLVVHFLQCYGINNPTVLPILCRTHPNLVDPDLKIEDVMAQIEDNDLKIQNWKSANTKSVGELALSLIEYYAKKFRIHDDTILIEAGQVFKKSQPRASIRLQIIDPYSNMTVARSELIHRAFAYAMNLVHKRMLEGDWIDAFPEFAEAKKNRYEYVTKEQWNGDQLD